MFLSPPEHKHIPKPAGLGVQTASALFYMYLTPWQHEHTHTLSSRTARLLKHSYCSCWHRVLSRPMEWIGDIVKYCLNIEPCGLW